MSQEKEFYSKVCVAGSIKFIVGEATEENIQLSDLDKFSCNLATILARDKEVVAVNLKILPNKCKVYIAKNNAWNVEDLEYLNKVKETLINVSKDAPMTFKQALNRNDMRDLYFAIMKYCSKKLEHRLNKLRNDMANKEGKIDDEYIQSFLDHAKNKKINADDIYNDKKKSAISRFCGEYYHTAKDDPTFPKKFLGHIKKVGSYIGSLMDITNCVLKDRYKTLFSSIDMNLLDPIHANQPIYSWKDVVQKFFHAQEKGYENFKKTRLKDYVIRNRLEEIYGGVDKQLERENVSHIYLHAELNVLTNIMNHDKERKFIAVSKRCCYLCESYIRFAQSKGHNIAFSGSHKKLYHGWKLPDAFKKEFMSDALFDLDQIIEREIERHVSISTKSDSGAESGSDNLNYDDFEFVDAFEF
ncbi:14597_t:CDS:1 [Acaulospora morrowiae]|uniref:14597_t:CDS:1 n=1 Tax=Acaulospora morrowiae TaxID=94023 RepID=A0A9N9CUD3_9GLOM|nr:14597_t:CDS:1 [Acaulospora morrowiae]